MTARNQSFGESDRVSLKRVMAFLVAQEVYDNPIIGVIKRAALGEGLKPHEFSTIQTLLTGITIGEQMKRKA